MQSYSRKSLEVVSLNAAGGDIVGGIPTGNIIKTKYGELPTGTFGKWIVNELSKDLYFEGLPFAIVAPEQYDVDQETRIKRINTWNFVKVSLCLTIDIHQNNDFVLINGNARNRSAEYGNHLQKELTALEDHFETAITDVNYSDENFYPILKKVDAPSFLVSFGVESNPEILLNDYFHENVIICLRNAIELCMKSDHGLKGKS